MVAIISSKSSYLSVPALASIWEKERRGKGGGQERRGDTVGEVEALMGAGHGFHHIWEGEKRSGGQEAEREWRENSAETEGGKKWKRNRLNEAFCFTSPARSLSAHLPSPLHPTSPSLAGWICNECFPCAEWQGVATADITCNWLQFHPLQFKPGRTGTISAIPRSNNNRLNLSM